jgi:hypothetical protein
MSGRQNKLHRLREELEIIAVFERLEKYSTDPNRYNDESRVLRENRRSKIFAEIAVLEGKKSWVQRSYASPVSIILLVSATACIYYFLK